MLACGVADGVPPSLLCLCLVGRGRPAEQPRPPPLFPFQEASDSRGNHKCSQDTMGANKSDKGGEAKVKGPRAEKEGKSKKNAIGKDKGQGKGTKTQKEGEPKRWFGAGGRGRQSGETA